MKKCYQVHLLVFAFLVAGCSSYESLRLASHNSRCDDNLARMIVESQPKLLDRVNRILDENTGSRAYHYVSADPSGGWQYGVLVKSTKGKLLLKESLGVEF